MRNSGRPFSSRPGSSGSRRYKGFEPECNPKRASPTPPPQAGEGSLDSLSRLRGRVGWGPSGRRLDIGPIGGVFPADLRRV